MRSEIYEIARVCHQANKAFCEANGDQSQTDWDKAPGWQRQSALLGVENKMKKDLTPEQMHESWRTHKAFHGWVYGPEKNEETKTHPCMVPYEELPEFQKRKDHLFSAIVEALTKEV